MDDLTTTEPGASSPPVVVRARGRPGARTWLILLLAVLLGAGWVAAGALVRPLDQTCDPALATGACHETIEAALRRGMPRLHPLILAAHAEPGPAAGPGQFGHRATVTFSLLGVPGPTAVRLYFDAGAHWGGISDRGDVELALWAVAQGVLVAAGAIGVWRLRQRRRA